MGTATLAFQAQQLHRWFSLLQAVEVETRNELTIHQAQELQGGQGQLIGVSEDDDHGDQEFGALKKIRAAKRSKREQGKTNMPGGPCAHCGALQSPQWRRPADQSQVLCNACGIYYGRHRQLPRGKSKLSSPCAISSADMQPVPALHVVTEQATAAAAAAPIVPSPPPASTLPAVLGTATTGEILLRPLRAVRTRKVRMYKPHTPTSSESHNEAKCLHAEPGAAAAAAAAGIVNGMPTESVMDDLYATVGALTTVSSDSSHSSAHVTRYPATSAPIGTSSASDGPAAAAAALVPAHATGVLACPPILLAQQVARRHPSKRRRLSFSGDVSSAPSGTPAVVVDDVAHTASISTIPRASCGLPALSVQFAVAVPVVQPAECLFQAQTSVSQPAPGTATVTSARAACVSAIENSTPGSTQDSLIMLPVCRSRGPKRLFSLL